MYGWIKAQKGRENTRNRSTGDGTWRSKKESKEEEEKVQQANINEDSQGQLQKFSAEFGWKAGNAVCATSEKASRLHELMNNTKLVVTVHRKIQLQLCGLCVHRAPRVLFPHFHPEKSPSFIHDPKRLDLHSVWWGGCEQQQQQCHFKASSCFSSTATCFSLLPSFTQEVLCKQRVDTCHRIIHVHKHWL